MDDTERTLLDEYTKAKSSKELLKTSLDEAKARFDKAEHAIIEFLDAKGAQSTAKYDRLGKVQLNKPRVRASCLKENTELDFIT